MARNLFRFALIACAATACTAGEITGITEGYVDTGEGAPTFLEFEAATYKEPGNAGVYIVNGDTPIANAKQLREYYDSLYSSALIVDQRGNADNVWDFATRQNLSYCVSDAFGGLKSDVVDALENASRAWEQAADVQFTYLASEDGNCNVSNGNVLFDVRPISGAPYLARAFFPNQYRQTRNVMIDSSAFGAYWSLTSVLSHELGHVLGFRHEHTRPEAGTCFEDNDWRPLTPYDAASIMHYPQCNGSGYSLTFSQTDYDGAADLYGAPNSGDEAIPTGGTAQTQNTAGSLEAGQQATLQPLDVLPGTPLSVQMTGTGDADLYVRFDGQPSSSQFDCRPYLNGTNEQCALDVPLGVSQAFILVHGYAAAEYQLAVEWTSP